jgi:hypothetical protein
MIIALWSLVSAVTGGLAFLGYLGFRNGDQPEDATATASLRGELRADSWTVVADVHVLNPAEQPVVARVSAEPIRWWTLALRAPVSVSVPWQRRGAAQSGNPIAVGAHSHHHFEVALGDVAAVNLAVALHQARHRVRVFRFSLGVPAAGAFDPYDPLMSG